MSPTETEAQWRRNLSVGDFALCKIPDYNNTLTFARVISETHQRVELRLHGLHYTLRFKRLNGDEYGSLNPFHKATLVYPSPENVSRALEQSSRARALRALNYASQSKFESYPTEALVKIARVLRRYKAKETEK